jgi:hypothetical protein
MELIILAVAVLAVWTWVKYDTLSPKLLVRESAAVAGTVVGATPVVVRTTIKAGKAANLASDVALQEAGTEGPLGFREGKAKAYTATKSALADTNSALDKSIADSLAQLEAIKAARAND